ncbi:metal ABC transporter ATP-binding protein [Winogradskya humida]|uniref:Manganese ABC transporter ATP-binding protein n=1 Tax=Winogradskya humida TaxID=113566 RepID=A0ABQ3ZJR5_9ACTN|nr:metal ABC transporter ATP-binding protein [Actinoplanes humidus]GIE18843.1 manganese ABC transporter ATP-binding protein [Actinoplanes humidus]
MAEPPPPGPVPAQRHASQPTALRIEAAGFGYRGTTVLWDVELTVGEGRTLALVGPNGAGKSTLIKSVTGLADLVTGSVTVLGRALPKARGLAAYVPQAETLDPDFPVSAADVVLMGRYRRIGWWRPTGRADRDAALAALDRVGLADRASTRFGLLSGGQRQRVLVARAIAAEARLLLLDEPLNGVDATSQERILTALGELTATGTAVVISTHDLAVAARIADQVCVLNGRQWAAGTPGEVLTPEVLREAYGNHAVDLPDGRTMLVET